MSEVFRLNCFGRVAYDLLVNRDTGTIRKNIIHLPDADKAGWALPDRQTYERLVGGSIKMMTDPRWALKAMLPDHITNWVEETPISSSGYQAVIEMDYIVGKQLHSIQSPEPETSSQLAYFIKGSTDMARTTRKELRRIFLPDLLGGVVNPFDQFQNFIVEEGTGRLYFVDTYPLAQISRRRLVPKRLDILGVRANYLRHLMRAAQATGSDEVLTETRKLFQAIQGD